MKDDQASSTAFTVLQGLLYTAKRPEYQHLVSEEVIKAAQAILSASESGQKRLQQLDSYWFLRLVPLLEWLMMPGITLHYALRKRVIEDVTLEALRNNIVQVVNLGAGFDTLAWRLHSQYSAVQFIEIDHPATNQLKEKALLQADNRAKNLHWVSVDFSRHSLKEALQGFSAFDEAKKTLFICEGVLMYLQQADVIQLLAEIRQLSGSETQCVFTCVESINSPKNNMGVLLKWYLNYKSEVLQWSIGAEFLAGFLHEQHYELLKISDSDMFKKNYLKSNVNPRLYQGEYIAVASIM
ncbi:MAG: class I SAM-dependent methyltransferase [Methylococcales bacterium]